LVDVELGAGMRKEWNVWACTAVCILEDSCNFIGVDIKLGGKRKVFVWGFSILVAFDVLNGRSECKVVE
jgi:hypothetical protein